MRVDVFTARFGPDSDPLRDPAFAAPDTRYYCASDQHVDSEIWRRIALPADPDPVTAARRFKVLLHERAGHAGAHLWMDARYRLEVDPAIFSADLLRADLLALRHPFCADLAEEARELERRGLVDKALLRKQLAAYNASGFPMDTPHSSTGLLLRRNDKRTAKFNQLWWSQMEHYGHTRDQMSFDWCAWKLGMAVKYLEGEYKANPYATWGMDG